MLSSIREVFRRVCRPVYPATLPVLVLALALPAEATDGVIEINQASALAGGITAGDAPGFPVTIGVGGSYRLTGSLSPGAGQPDATALVVSTPNGVVIDLNGFTLQGPSTCNPQQPCAPAGSARGIDATAGPATTVRNGIVRGFPGGGLSLGTRARVEAVSAFGNGFSGIQVSDGGIVTGCIAGTNVGNGIQTGQSATVDGNTVDGNGQNGIQTSLASIISHNTASGNHIGIAAGGTSMVVSNSARSNTGAGIACNGCQLIGNSAHANTGVGFQLDAAAGYSQSILRANNGGNEQAQVSNGVDLGQNLCGAPEVGNGIVCP